MIYIADGPSDVPSFSVVGGMGGHTFGVHTGGSTGNYEGVRRLLDEGRVMAAAAADYRPDTEADLWLMSTLNKVCEQICHRRESMIRDIVPPAGHHI